MDRINNEDQNAAEWRWCLAGNIVEKHEYVEVVIRRKLVRNFRVQKVYKPAVLKLINASEWDRWDNSDETRETLEKSAERMNAEAAENDLKM